jgi:hypothetical protein
MTIFPELAAFYLIAFIEWSVGRAV